MSITLGHRVIGKEAAARQQATLVDHIGGGAIQLGQRLTSQKYKTQPVESHVNLAPPPATPPKSPEARTPRSTANKVPKPAQAPKAPEAPAVASFSEQEIELMLATDPNAWDKVCEAEIARPEGWRPAVAHMVLNAAPEAKDKPIPTPMLEELRATVKRQTEADLEVMRKSLVAHAEKGE